MIIAIDSYYYSDTDCYTVGVMFDKWDQEKPSKIMSCRSSDFEIYRPGNFYKRELPGILRILEVVSESGIQIDTVVLDSYIDLMDRDGNISAGLGNHLRQVVGESRFHIIGVAKTLYGKCNEISSPVRRGNATNPIWVQGSGITNEEAANLVYSMYGSYKIPNLLRILDKETKKYR
jgi:deoxyinosine 3'endonuclease (endonuclease V)